MKKAYLDTLSSKKIIKDQSLLRHEDIRQQIRIIPELKALIPPLLPDELTQLENNIRRDGCREALLLWETTEGTLANTDDQGAVYVLVDGHNRYAICQRNNLDFRVSLKPFTGMDEVRTFMIENQLGRRNLTPEQTAYLRGLRYRDEKGERGKYDRAMANVNTTDADQSDALQRTETPAETTKPTKQGSTAQKLAKQFNVNEKTIKRDAAFAAGVEKLSPALRADVLSGKTGANKKFIEQLGQSDIPDGSLTSLDELSASAPTVTKGGPSPATRTTQPKKQGKPQSPALLQKKLKALANQVSSAPEVDISLCDQLVAYATQLKTALLENH